MVKKTTGLATLLLVFISACSISPSLQTGNLSQNGELTPTACGCSEAGVATPTGGFSPPGPSVPSQPSMPATDSQSDAKMDSVAWLDYTNQVYGFTFQYPAVYNESNFNFCTVRSSRNLPPESIFQIAIGSRTLITLYKSNQNPQEAYIEFQAKPANKNLAFEKTQARSIGGEPAVIGPYRSGGTNRYAENVFFSHKGILYHVETGIPSACDVPGLNLREFDAYNHLLDSFKFTK
jgi:hypothetical protein